MQTAGHSLILMGLSLLLGACVAGEEDLLHSEWAIHYGLGDRPLSFGQEYNANKTVVSFDSIVIYYGTTAFVARPVRDADSSNPAIMHLSLEQPGQIKPFKCRLKLFIDGNSDGQAETPIDLEFHAGQELQRLSETAIPEIKASAHQIEINLLPLLEGIDWEDAADPAPRKREAVEQQLEKNLPKAISLKEQG